MEQQVRENLAYHYTSVDSFIKIFDGIENEKIKFHASSIFSLNDPTEMEYGYREIMKKLPQIEEEFSISDANYKLSKLWNKDTSYSYDEWYRIHLNKMKDYFQYPYVISYARNRENRDNLQLWRMYGNNGKGMALGLDLRLYFIERPSQDGIRILDSTHINFGFPHAIDVEYGTISLKNKLFFLIKGEYSRYLKTVQGIIDKEEIVQKQLNALSHIMILLAPFVKHNAYEREKESRIISVPQKMADVKFKLNTRGNIIPYIEVPIPASCLKEVIVGPCCDYNEIRNYIKIRFLQLGIDGVDIIQSTIPYRC